ncbi:hypothetical protein BsIDN1_31500 [Bacillus safensis]|uniref:Uncharacterized protein n=1 Tax=Bacillus safensis TaxID=561879 RepID=A0A5S9MAC6_BACIA|nr:hypothetical protein BsIDN1_31500 [Bacillus safensis]
MGNHTWDKRDIFDFIDDAANMVRPANFPEGTPGKGLTFIKKTRKRTGCHQPARTYVFTAN